MSVNTGTTVVKGMSTRGSGLLLIIGVNIDRFYCIEMLTIYGNGSSLITYVTDDRFHCIENVSTYGNGLPITEGQ